MRLFGKTAVLSADGDYYYIRENHLTNTTKGGWLMIGESIPENGGWLPFIFWKVKRGIERKATKDEVRRYKEMIESI